jgi:predicted porin
MRVITNKIALAPLMGACLLAAAPASADVWKFWGSASAEVGTDTNIRLRPDQDGFGDKGNVYGGEVQLEANRYADKYDVQIAAGGDYKNYFNDDEEDRRSAGFVINNPLRTGFQPRISIASQYRIDELTEIGGFVSYREEQTNDAVSSTDLGETDLGFNQDIIERQTTSGGLSYSRSLTERLKGELSWRHTEREYPGIETLSDSENDSFTLETKYRLSEKNEFVTDLEYMDYSSGVVATDRYSAMVGVLHSFTPVTNVKATIGYVRQDSKSLTDNREGDTGEIEAKIALNHRGERSNVSLIAERTQKPSISGVFVESNIFSVRASYGISERIGSSIIVRWFDNERGDELNQGNAPSGDNRNYLSIRPQLNWAVNEKWSTYVRYEYRRQDRKDFDQTEDSNAIYFGVQFKPPREIK